MARPKSAQATAAKAQDKQPQATAATVQATAQSPVQASAQVPAGFTPVKYIFRRQAHTDALYGTRIVWDNPGDVRLVPEDVAAKMLARNPDVYQLGEYSGESAPAVAAKPAAPDDAARQELDLVIRTMDKEALEGYAKTHFGQDLDRRKSVESLRQQVAMLVDQFGAP